MIVPYLGEDRERERVPRRENIVFFYLLSLFHKNVSTVNDLMSCHLTSALIHQAELGGLSPHRDLLALTVLDDVPVTDEFNRAVDRRSVFGLLFETSCTTDMEGTHRELCAGLADTLSSDDADGFTDLDRFSGG